MAIKKPDTTDGDAEKPDASLIQAPHSQDVEPDRGFFDPPEPEEPAVRAAITDEPGRFPVLDDPVRATESRTAPPKTEPEFQGMFVEEREPMPVVERAGPSEPQNPTPFAHEETQADEDTGPSFASRALTWLLLLAAGAGIGIWGAPKLAPMLPSGLAPVAAWLTPGAAETASEIAGLNAKLDNALGEMAARVNAIATPAQIEDRSRALIGEAEARIGAEIQALKDALAAADGGEARERLDQLEATIDGQIAEFGTIKQQLAGNASVASTELTAEAVARIDVYRAELDGVRAEVGTLSGKVGALGARVDEVAAAAERQVLAAQSRVAEIENDSRVTVNRSEVQSDLALISAALAGGQTFTEPLARLGETVGVPIPDGLSAAATTGVASLAQLRESFPDAAHAAIRSNILASSGEGLIGRSRAYLEAQIASRSLTPKDGVGPDAVLSRMEDALRRDDLDAVLSEADQLPAEAAAEMSGWLDAARLRAEATAGLQTLSAELSATN